jgi:hypothetical protein
MDAAINEGENNAGAKVLIFRWELIPSQTEGRDRWHIT